MRWFFLIVGLIAAELVLLVVAGWNLGVWPTLGLLALSAALGVVFTRSEGLRVWRGYREALRNGQMPEEGILSGLLVLAGGILLLLPGFLSDLAGLALLLPWTRKKLASRVRDYVTARIGALRVVDLASPVQAQVYEPEPFYTDDPGDEREVIDTEGVLVETERLLPAPQAAGPDRDRGG